ncbi:MAG: SEA (Seh1-associated) complex subunit [Vezdaea aestivalis]|nr:MAG: SEA (Seh1-associated) complex subunit [Vezdaea aestivalis]
MTAANDFHPPRPNGPSSSSSVPPPPAPPLPPQRYAQRATNAFVRFAQPFIGASRPPSAHDNRSDDLTGRLPPTSVPRSSIPASSQTTSHRTGIPIAALDISPGRSHVVLAGAEILKTVRVAGTRCAEEFNLRTALINYASTHNNSDTAISAKHRDQLAAVDVKWSHGSFASTIATAAANGKIVIYDINRPGVELGRIVEHQRQVHSLDFNPNGGHLLLSGSQDSSIRLWDMRANQKGKFGITWWSRDRFATNSDGVRHVKWSPSDVFHFACATDTGVIQKWDIRKNSGPLLRITAHSKTCTAIDFHPDGKHVASASADKTVKVWDFSSSDRRQKPKLSINTPHGVTKAIWRPAGFASKSQPSKSCESTQIVTTYGAQDPRVHIWDLKRPHVPLREIDKYGSAPTCMLWHSEDLLWTAGLEGMFTQTDVQFVPRPYDRRPLQALDCAANGPLTFQVQKRPDRRNSSFAIHSNIPATSGSSQSKDSGEKLSGSKSATDESADDSFDPNVYSSSFRRRNTHQFQSKSPSKSLSNTPPSSVGLPIVELEAALGEKSSLPTNQQGIANFAVDAEEPKCFEALANKYQFTGVLFQDEIVSARLDLLLESVFERNAGVAQELQCFRLAQTWRILAELFSGQLKDRAESQRTERLSTARTHTGKSYHDQDKELKNPSFKYLAPAAVDSPKDTAGGSGATTPLARRASQSSIATRETEKHSLADEQTSASHLESGKPYHSSTREQMRQDHRRFSFGKPRSYLESSPVTIDSRRRPASRFALGPDTPPARDLPKSGRPDRRSDSFSLSNPALGHSFNLRTDSFDSEEMRIGKMSFEDEPFRPSLLPHQSFGSDSSGHNLRPSARSSFEDDVFRSDHSELARQSIESKRLTASSTIVPDENALEDLSPFPSPDISMKYPSSSPYTLFKPSTLSQPPQTPSLIPSDFFAGSSTSSLPRTTHLNAFTLVAHLTPYLLSPSLTDLATLSTALVLLLPFFPALLPPPLVFQTLLTYHTHLLSHSLYATATSLRLASQTLGPLLRPLWYPYTLDVHLKHACLSCQRAIRLGSTSPKCPKCTLPFAPCMICQRRSRPKLWSWCPACGHGGHMTCVEEWFVVKGGKLSGGQCAVGGCGCDCRKGSKRDERVAREKQRKDSRREEDRRGERRGSVPVWREGDFGRKSVEGEESIDKDGWEVGESQAVKEAVGFMRRGFGGGRVGGEGKSL